jgi:hypothetical protein
MPENRQNRFSDLQLREHPAHSRVLQRAKFQASKPFHAVSAKPFNAAIKRMILNTHLGDMTDAINRAISEER